MVQYTNLIYYFVQMTKKKSNAGRPKKLTQKTLAKLEYAFSCGCPVTEACLYADIDVSTFYRNIPKGSKLFNRYMHLKDKPLLNARMNITKAVQTKDLDTSKWYAERKAKEEFSTRQEQKRESDVVIKLFSNRKSKGDKD
jgi:hypothetical protein